MDLDLRDEPLGAGARRVALGLVDEALAELAPAPARSGPPSPRRRPEDAVHNARKRCKELRAVLRLVRPTLGEDPYRAQNERFRDASRLLSPIRDAHALLETFDELVAADAARAAGPVGEVRAELRRRAMAASSSVHDDDPRISEARAMLEEGRTEVAAWSLPDDWDMVRAGVAKIHRQARRELAEARATADVHAFHDLRKRVKYLWYHARMLRRIAPDLVDPLAATLKVLSDTLGDAHDLVVLVEEVTSDPARFGGPAEVAATVALADHRRLDLERRGLNLAGRMFAEPSDAFVARLDGWWEATREIGEAVTAGGIDAVADTTDHLDQHRVDELRAEAAATGVRGRWAMRKDELVCAVRAARAGGGT